MKKILALTLALLTIFAFASCGGGEKNISVIVREQGSGTREAFDKVVTDGTHFLEEKDADGKKVYNTTDTAIQQTKTGTVLSAVASDKNAIGYISMGSVNDTINVIKVNGVAPSEKTVLSGDYKIQRPFVLMTKKGQTMTDLAADFMNYLKSDASAAHSESAGCIFLSDPAKRANEGAPAIAVTAFTKQAALPTGDKIVIRGSTSMEKFINAAAKGYADLYGAKAEDIFDIQLEGSSVGVKAVEDDTKGNVIGMSSASVNKTDIDSFNVCLDAVVVIVNKENTSVTDLTLAQLYDIFSGKITKFSELK
ncbi:MAG: substrate-binding domain-containing protein [Eubacteriales bacterium]